MNHTHRLALYFRALGIYLLVFFASCATTAEHDPFQFRLSRFSAPGKEPAALATRDAKCKPVLEKRIVHFLFALPMNGLTARDYYKLRRVKTLRVKRVARPLDFLFSFFGIWVSIVTTTTVYEECKPDYAIHAFGEVQSGKKMGGRISALQKELQSARSRLKELNRKLAALDAQNKSFKRHSGDSKRLSADMRTKIQEMQKRIKTQETEIQELKANAKKPRFVISGFPLIRAYGRKANPESSISFKPGSPEFQTDAGARLDSMAERLKLLHPSVRVLIIAFGTKDGKDQNLPRARAQAVREELIKRGVPTGSLHILAAEAAKKASFAVFDRADIVLAK